MKRSIQIAASAGLALVTSVLPAGADTAFPSSISVYPYPIVASPAKYPVTVVGCGVFRTGHHLHVGFAFKNLELTSMTAVKISVDLYDPFHNLLTTLDSTINGDYSPNAIISVPEIETPGDRMPVFEAFDAWPDAASAVCYVSSVLYANGDVWNATERPSFDAALHAGDDLKRDAVSNVQNIVASERAREKAAGYTMAAVSPSPLVMPDGWKALHVGFYVDLRDLAAVGFLSYTSLTGPGAKAPLAPSDIPNAQNMTSIQVTDQHATTVCGNRPADYLALQGTTSAGSQIIEAIKVRKNGVSYVSSYTRSFGKAPNASAEAALDNICY